MRRHHGIPVQHLFHCDCSIPDIFCLSGTIPATNRTTSSAFQHESTIPVRYTCDGPDVSPPLKWEGTPDGTRSLVLICDDPDAPMGTWVHWVMYNIPGDRTELPEDVPKQDVVFGQIKQGINDFKRIGYGGSLLKRSSWDCTNANALPGVRSNTGHPVKNHPIPHPSP